MAQVRGARLAFAGLGIAVFAGLWALAAGHLYSIDGLMYFRGATRLAFDGSFHLQPPLRWGSAVLSVPNGAIGLSLVYVPALLPLLPWAHLQPAPTAIPYDWRLLYADPIWVAISWVQPAIAGFTAVLVAGTIRRIAGSLRLGVVAGLVYAFATPMLHYGRADFTQPLTGLLLLATVLLALRAADHARDRAVIVVIVVAIGVLVRPVDGALAAAVALVLVPWWRTDSARRMPALGGGSAAATRFAFLTVIGVAVGVALSLVFNVLRQGHPFDFGYGSQGFTTPLPFGLLAYLVSPGRALIWYAPIALLVPFGCLALWRAGRRLELASLVLPCVVWLLVYSAWQGLGGWAWGPRFLVPILPLVTILAALAVHRSGAAARVAFAGLAIAGLALNATQLFVDPLQSVWGVYGDNVYPTAGFWDQFRVGSFQPVLALQAFHVDRLSDLLDVVWLRAMHDTGGLSLVFGGLLAVSACLATLAAIVASREAPAGSLADALSRPRSSSSPGAAGPG